MPSLSWMMLWRTSAAITISRMWSRIWSRLSLPFRSCVARHTPKPFAQRREAVLQTAEGVLNACAAAGELEVEPGAHPAGGCEDLGAEVPRNEWHHQPPVALEAAVAEQVAPLGDVTIDMLHQARAVEDVLVSMAPGGAYVHVCEHPVW